jgi:hypothetical protein
VPIVELNANEFALLMRLRMEAERITKDLPEEEQAAVLSSLYAWRNDKIVTQAERS